MERYNHAFYVCCRNKARDKVQLLRYPTSFFYLTYLQSFTFEWMASGLISGIWLWALSYSWVAVIGWGFGLGVLGSVCSLLLIWFYSSQRDKHLKMIFSRQIMDTNREAEKISKRIMSSKQVKDEEQYAETLKEGDPDKVEVLLSQDLEADDQNLVQHSSEWQFEGGTKEATVTTETP